jgi:hypothetical protein
MLMPMGSKLARFEGVIVAQCTRTAPAKIAASAMPIKMVNPTVHIVERTVRSFVHSERSSPARP